jgi:Leucine-rich repeat (LRR) protein
MGDRGYDCYSSSQYPLALLNSMTRDELLQLIDRAQQEGWEELDLAGNDLEELPPEIGKLTRLKTLILGKWDEEERKRKGNQLSTLPESIGQLTNLQSLDLRNNSLNTLPESIGELTNLQSLNLSSNGLNILPEFIGELTNLQSLNLSSNGLNILPKFIGELTNLQSLNLSSNGLNILPKFIGELTNLQSLNLSSNGLSTLPEFIGQLTNLQSLNLHFNGLNILPEFIGELTNLQSLDLHFNGLNTLPAEIGQLTNLQSLDLRSNGLSTLPEFIGELTNLQSLNLSSNELNILPEFIGELTNLQSLDLHFNGLNTLPAEIGQLTNLQSLDLRSNGLSTLPEFIGELTNLQSLNLSSNELNILPEFIGELTNLQSLNLSSNGLNILPEFIGQLTNLQSLDLHFNGLNTLPAEIGQLTNLQSLDLSSNGLSTLPEFIGQLTNLQSLDLRSNELKALPAEIGQLINLVYFDISFNLLKSLPEAVVRLRNLKEFGCAANQITALPKDFGRLTKLEVLNLGGKSIELNNFQISSFRGNLLSDLPPGVGQLTNLQSLDLSSNSLSTLPEFIRQLPALKRLDLRGNPVPIPPEILGPKKLNTEPGDLKAILNFYFQIQDPDETEPLYEAKLLIVGEGGAGKTSLAKKIENETYNLDAQEQSTEGIEVIRWGFPLPNGQEFRVNIWDFGGQEIYHATHQFFLTKRSVYALVADIRQENTDFYYWLNVVELLSDNSPVIIIKNEKQDRQCPINERQLRGEFTNLEKTLATNLHTNRGLDEIKDAIQLYLSHLPHIGTPLPKIWVRVRSALENYAQHCNYISDEKYFELCRQNGFTDRLNMLQLSSYLHDLGVCLHFQDDDLLKKTVILKPEWGTTAVYKVLDTPKVKANYGRFTREDLTEIWSDAEYAEMCGELLHLMMRFKLCYEIRDQPHHYISPQLLEIEQPPYDWDTHDNLILRYKYEFMPKGILTRLIVELHQWIEQQTLVWKTGVVLTNGRARAEVIEYYHKGEIIVRVSGNDKKGWLSVIDHEFNQIHASYERLKYSKLVPCNCNTCKGSQEPHTYSLETLLQFLQDRNPIQCQKSYAMVDVRRLIDDVLDFETVVKEQRKSGGNISSDRDLDQRVPLETAGLHDHFNINIYNDNHPGDYKPMSEITNNNQGANIANLVNEAKDNAQVTASHFNQTTGINTTELLQLIAAMRQTVAQLPPEVQEDIIIDIDDVEEQIKKPENQRNLPRLRKRLIALAAVGTTVAAQISGATDFAGKAIDVGNKAVELGSKLGIELQLPPAP